MPISIIGSNLNQWGNNGQFETDPSTWNYSTDYVTSRSSAEQTAGLYSAKQLAFGNDFNVPTIFNPFNGSILSVARISVDGSRKYIATAKIKTPSASQIAPDACYFKIENDLSSLFVNAIATTTKTVADAKDAWVTVQFQFDTDGSGLLDPPADGTNMNLRLVIYPNIPGTDHIAFNGVVYIDQFEVYEYIDVVPGCTLAIDVPGTVVDDASGPLATDGSITVAITGGTGPFQYSKDDGATWQVSPYFAGLAHGIYPMKVMDDDGCTASQSFSVNDAAAAFDFTLDKTDETIAGLNNGSITVTVTGAGGPFTFSKDGGATYQPENLFLGLAPGTYTIVVQDSLGNIIAHNITILAGTIIFDKVWWSRNPIIYPAAAAPGWDALTNVRLYNDVQVDENTDGTFTSKLKVDLPPDDDGNVVFYNREAFTDSLKAVAPSLNENTIIRLTDRIKFFKNNTAQLQDDQVDPPGPTTASLPHLVLLGGLGKFAWASMDFFGSYLPTNKKFLTWAPLIKPVDKNQEDYLNYFVFTLSTATLKLRIKAYYDDNTNQTAIVTTLAGVVYGQLYQIPAGPANTGAAMINPAKNLVKYELSLLDQGDAVISEVRTYVLDEFTHPRKRLFMVLNSLGSYEVLRFTGVATKSVVISKTEVAKFLPYNYNALDGEFDMNNVSMRNSNNMSSGYIKQTDALAWAEYLQDFLSSRKVFDVTDGKRRPIQIQPATFPIAQDQNYEYFVRFTAADAYDDENYTPKL